MYFWFYIFHTELHLAQNKKHKAYTSSGPNGFLYEPLMREKDRSNYKNGYLGVQRWICEEIDLKSEVILAMAR